MNQVIRKLSAVFAALVMLSCALECAAADRSKDDAAVTEVVKQMEDGWNQKSGSLFARPFSDDADYVVINGMHIQGRPAIEMGHQQIFDTIYKDTSLKLALKKIRYLGAGVAIAHVLAHTKTPQADGAREREAVLTLVLSKQDGGWKIVAFQITEISRS